MRRFFSVFFCILGSLLFAQEQVNFEAEVKRIDSLIVNRNFSQADSALLALKASLENTSLLSEDTVLLYFSSNLALVNYQLGNCENTIKYSKEDLLSKQTVYGEGDLVSLAASRNLGIYYLNCDSAVEAKEVLEGTIALHDQYVGTPDEIYVRTLDDLGFTLGKLDEIENAIAAYEKLLLILGEAKSTFYYHVIENYSAFLMSKEKYEEASLYFEDLKNYMVNKAEYPIFLKDYYNVFVHVKDYVRALEASKLIISSCAENQLCGESEIDLNEFTLNSARLSMLLSRFNDAGQFYSHVEESYEGNSSIYVSILLEEAELYGVTGNRDLHLSKLNKVIAYQRSNGLTDSSSFTRAVTNLGSLYTETGKFELADELFTSYISDLETKGADADPTQLAMAYQSLGNQRYLLQNFKDADAYLVKAKNLLEKRDLSGSNEYASILNSLGALYEGLANYEKAELNYRKALSIASGASSSLRIALASNLANVLLTTEPENDSIGLLLNKALEWQIEATGENHPAYANQIAKRGAQYQNIGEYENAKNDFLKALNIFQYTVGADHPQYLSTISNLGLLYDQMESYEEALETMLKARTLYEKSYPKSNPGFILALNNLANLYTKMRKFEDAEPLLLELASIQVEEINKSFTYLSDSEKKSFVKQKQKLLDNFKVYVVERSLDQENTINPEVVVQWYNLELSTKGILLNSTRKVREQIFNSGDQDLIQMFSEWTIARKQVADIQSLKNEQQENSSQEVEILTNKIDNLEKEISRRSTDFSKSFASNAPTYNDLSQRLGPGEAMVEIVRTQIGEDAVYTALIGTPGTKYPKIIAIGKGEELEKRAYKGYKNGITFEIEDAKPFEAFWRQIHNYLFENGTTRVYYAPDGVYHRISLSTLFNPDSKNYLLEELEIIQLTSTKDLLKLKQGSVETAHESKQVLLVGRPSFSMNEATSQVTGSSRASRGFAASGVTDLPGTEEEVMEIESLFGKNDISCKLLLQQEADEATLKSNLNSEYVHIATHGFFIDGSKSDIGFSDPMMNSGLLLAGASDQTDTNGEDGILTAFEIMNLELSNANMVVLSACETGIGEVSSGEGIYGLQRAFFVGGANTVVMSLWKVDDQATRDLMISFYKELLKKGNQREAFINAQKKMRKKYKSPIFWGAFVMVGGQ